MKTVYNNTGASLILQADEIDCNPNVFLNEAVNISKNEASFIMWFSLMGIYMNGTIAVLENNVQYDI